MTESEFMERHGEILAKIPSNFHPAVSWYAWEHGHATGYQAVLEILSEIVNEILIPSLQEKSNDLE